jgi:hypothetical protein|tara:strand:- start:11 stop:178 length:168 start_codon:yes stop_codon:yes gene_type:complete
MGRSSISSSKTGNVEVTLFALSFLAASFSRSESAAKQEKEKEKREREVYEGYTMP